VRAIYQIDPLTDCRWEGFVSRTPAASAFHSREWLKALHQAYGYRPIVFTTSEPSSDLTNGIVFCSVESWLTGRRLVSLPFSDHCDVLVRTPEDSQALMAGIEHEINQCKWRYIEMRPISLTELAGANRQAAATYYHHSVDLVPERATIFGKFHKASIQRKIRRAQRENLEYQEGATDSLIDSFYTLLVSTRRRHRVPPQPKKWFRILRDCFGGALKIRLATKDGRPIAGMLTIRHKNTLIYKYGASDPRFWNLGGTHLLYWTSIQEAKKDGLTSFDLGRSDADQPGLATFKRRWGAQESKLIYWRFGRSGKANMSHMLDTNRKSWKVQLAKDVFASLPTSVLPAIGRVLYKHIG
jgi:Acetyltransferase (GNAT) domain